MSIYSIGAQSRLAMQPLMDMRAKLEDLQRQLATGKRSDTYSGIGLDRGLTVGLRSHLSAIKGYDNTITIVGTRINLAQMSLTRMATIGQETKSAVLKASYDPDGTGASTVQKTALASLGEMLGLLNTQAGDHYLFSGRATDKPAVETLDHIMNGDGSRAGLKQVIDERKQADLGADGLGRLVLSSPSATSVSLAEDSATSPFGLKLSSIGSTLTGGTVSGPTGSPPSVSVDLAGNPNAGETLRLAFTLPDGTVENITLTATESAPPGKNEFSIGASAADTAANLQAAMSTAIGHLANTSLTAASAVAASNDFFNADAAHPAQRVDGPPFDTATGMIDGTEANTVQWYTGEAGSDPARSTSAARVDQSITVAYGVRASEEGIRSIIQNLAALAATSFDQSDPEGAAAAAALGQRVRDGLDTATESQTILNITVELAGAQSSIKAAKDRHQQTFATLGDFLNQIEGVTNEEVGSQILALQTRLQASLQTTAMLYQISLVNYL